MARPLSRIALTAAAASVIACIALRFAAAATPVDALVDWAEHAAVDKGLTITWSTPTKIDDHFGSVPYAQLLKGTRDKQGLAANGTDLPTADAGSRWVYDYKHGIAAETFGGDEIGDAILYAGPPPSKIASRELSNVVSAHGLELGMTPSQAAHDLGVSVSAVRRLNAHQSALSTNDMRMDSGSKWGHAAIIVFNDGRAVLIRLEILGP